MAPAMLVEPLTSSLKAWGAKTLVESSDHLSMGIIAGHVLGHHAPKTEPIKLAAHFRAHGSGDNTTLLLNLAFVMVCVTMLFICLQSSRDDSEDEVGDSTPLPQKAGSLRDDSTSLPHKMDSLKDIPSRGGSWAKAHRDAKGEEREALELLFRCHIISEYEFAESKVTPEHIDECVWIGSQMLLEKSLTDWAAISAQAKQVFEDHSASRFLARSDSRSSRFRPSTTTPDQTATENLTPTSSFLSLNSQPEAEKATPRSNTAMRIPCTDQHNSSGHQQKKLFRPATQISRLDYPSTLETPPKVPPKSAIHVPRVDLRSLSLAKEQSSREDDDDPYTTRSVF